MASSGASEVGGGGGGGGGGAIWISAATDGAEARRLKRQLKAEFRAEWQLSDKSWRVPKSSRAALLQALKTAAARSPATFSYRIGAPKPVSSRSSSSSSSSSSSLATTPVYFEAPATDVPTPSPSSPSSAVAPLAKKRRAGSQGGKTAVSALQQLVPAEFELADALRLVNSRRVAATKEVLAEWLVAAEHQQRIDNGYDSVRPQHRPEWVRSQPARVLKYLVARHIANVPGAGINFARVAPHTRGSQDANKSERAERKAQADAAERAALQKIRDAAIASHRAALLADGLSSRGRAQADVVVDEAVVRHYVGRLNAPELVAWLDYKDAVEAISIRSPPRHQSPSGQRSSPTGGGHRSGPTGGGQRSSPTGGGAEEKKRNGGGSGDNDGGDRHGVAHLSIGEFRERVWARATSGADLEVLKKLASHVTESKWRARERSRSETLTATLAGGRTLLAETEARLRPETRILVRITEAWTEIQRLPIGGGGQRSSPTGVGGGGGRVGEGKEEDVGNVEVPVELEFHRMVPAIVVEYQPAVRSSLSVYGIQLRNAHLLVDTNVASGGWGRSRVPALTSSSSSSSSAAARLSPNRPPPAVTIPRFTRITYEMSVDQLEWRTSRYAPIVPALPGITAHMTAADLAASDDVLGRAIARLVHAPLSREGGGGAGYHTHIGNLVGAYATGNFEEAPSERKEGGEGQGEGQGGENQ